MHPELDLNFTNSLWEDGWLLEPERGDWNCFMLFTFFYPSFSAKPQRPGLPPARPQRAPPKPRRSLPPRAIPGRLTLQAHRKPNWHRVTTAKPESPAHHLGEVQVTRPGGNWAFPPLPPRLQPREHRPRPHWAMTSVCCGWTSTAHALWRLWLDSREIRAVPTSCCAGWRTGTETTVEARPSLQVLD